MWRIDSDGSKLLVNGSHSAWLRAGNYIIGSIGDNGDYQKPMADILLEFTQGSVDPAVHNREGVRHYVIDADKVSRIDPVTLSPRDFVDEWITSQWKESSNWSNSTSLLQWHKKMQQFSGEFSPTMHCRTSELWQVTLAPYEGNKPQTYFLVRWRPPFHFTMMNVSDKPWPLCGEEDPSADEWRTLFAVQEWRH